VRDREYLKWLTTLPCCVCVHLGELQQTRTQAHHLVRTKGAFGGDDGAAPFCEAHHQQWHVMGRKSFAARVGFDPVPVARQLWKEWQERGWAA
jgi:hypothetical protein